MKPSLEGLLPQIDAYAPSAETLARLEGFNTVRITGPPQIGKTVCAQEVAKDENFRLVQGFSSDPATEGRHIQTEEDLEWLETQLSDGTVAHILRGPAGEITGSTIDEYVAPFPVVELPFRAIPKLPSKQAPYMLVGYGDHWIQRLKEHFGPKDLSAQLKDAEECLMWAGKQKTWNLNWAFNVIGNPHTTAEDIRGIATAIAQGNRSPQASAIYSHFVGNMLKAVHNEQAAILGTGSGAPDQTESAR